MLVATSQSRQAGPWCGAGYHPVQTLHISVIGEIANGFTGWEPVPHFLKQAAKLSSARRAVVLVLRPVFTRSVGAGVSLGFPP